MNAGRIAAYNPYHHPTFTPQTVNPAFAAPQYTSSAIACNPAYNGQDRFVRATNGPGSDWRQFVNVDGMPNHGHHTTAPGVDPRFQQNVPTTLTGLLKNVLGGLFQKGGLLGKVGEFLGKVTKSPIVQGAVGLLGKAGGFLGKVGGFLGKAVSFLGKLF